MMNSVLEADVRLTNGTLMKPAFQPSTGTQRVAAAVLRIVEWN
jgi:hypothetical protein